MRKSIYEQYPILHNPMSSANQKINSSVDNAVDKTGTSAGDIESEQVISSLWDRTFMSYSPEMIVKLPYYFQIHVAQGPGLSTGNQFKLNSLYDFDLTGLGHQPLGRDTWASIYDYYKVLETRVHVTHVSEQYATGAIGAIAGNLIDSNSGSTYLAPCYVGGLFDISSNPPTTLTNWQEAQQVTSNSQQRFTPIQRFERIGSRPNSTVFYSMTWTPDMFDTAVINEATQNTWTPVGSDPQNLNYFSDVVYNSNSGGNNISYSLEVKATMLVAFKNVNRSLLLTTN
nr:MAG: capsid protein [Cressdnaviricota sp.]